MTAPTVRVSIPAPIYTRDPFASRFSRCSLSSSDYPDTPRTLTFDESGYAVPYTLRLDCHNHSIPQFDSHSLFQPEHVRSTESEGVVGPDCSATCVKPATLSFFQFGFRQYFSPASCLFTDPYFYQVFPPLWLVGSFVLLYRPFCTSTSDDNSWIHAKTPTEKQAFSARTRKAELKYAKWCLLALVMFVCVVGIVTGLALWASRRWWPVTSGHLGKERITRCWFPISLCKILIYVCLSFIRLWFSSVPVYL